MADSSTASYGSDMPFAHDSPSPRRASLQLLHETHFTRGPSPLPARRSRKRASKTTAFHIRADSIDSIDESYWEPTTPPKHLPHAAPPPKDQAALRGRPSLADLTNSIGILAVQGRPRLAASKSTPALRTTVPRAPSPPTTVLPLAPARTAAQRVVRTQVISSSVKPDADLPSPQRDRHARQESQSSCKSLESLVDIIVGEKGEKDVSFTPSSPEVIRIVETQWAELFARDERDRERRRVARENSLAFEPSPLVFSPPPAYEPSLVEVHEPRSPDVDHSRKLPDLRHATSTPALRSKPSQSTLAGRREPKLLRSAASLAALRPVVSPANGEILANGSARVVNDPTPLRRRQQVSKERSVPPSVASPTMTIASSSSSSVFGTHSAPLTTAINGDDRGIVSFPNAEEVAEKLNAAMRAKRRQKKWYHTWLQYGPNVATPSGTSVVVAKGATNALRGLLGEGGSGGKPALSRVPSLEMRPRILISDSPTRQT